MRMLKTKDRWHRLAVSFANAVAGDIGAYSSVSLSSARHARKAKDDRCYYVGDN